MLGIDRVVDMLGDLGCSSDPISTRAKGDLNQIVDDLQGMVFDPARKCRIRFHTVGGRVRSGTLIDMLIDRLRAEIPKRRRSRKATARK